ncbi:MAG: Crp/Fnr family transcriptional regulator [Pedobacter sp.]|nr:MAG: Crp/Fnr family transcriptional regulator [Pedobacter sp.]
MLNNRKTFAKLVDRLQAVYPNVPLPDGLDEYLWQEMKVEELCIAERILEREGAVPAKAYFVVRGPVIVEGFVNGLPFTESIYRENTIVGLNAFMKQEVSVQTVTGMRDSLVWSIKYDCLLEIYKRWPQMEAMALQTALDYLELKRAQRSVLQALPEEERVFGFYTAFKGMLPVRRSPLSDSRIATYLAMPLRHMRECRMVLRNRGLL